MTFSPGGSCRRDRFKIDGTLRPVVFDEADISDKVGFGSSNASGEVGGLTARGLRDTSWMTVPTPP